MHALEKQLRGLRGRGGNPTLYPPKLGSKHEMWAISLMIFFVCVQFTQFEGFDFGLVLGPSIKLHLAIIPSSI